MPEGRFSPQASFPRPTRVRNQDEGLCGEFRGFFPISFVIEEPSRRKRPGPNSFVPYPNRCSNHTAAIWTGGQVGKSLLD